MAVVTFSTLFKQSNQISAFSPNGQFLVVVLNQKLTLKDGSSLQTLQIYSCQDNIHAVQWSSNSMYIMCLIPKKNLVQVWSVENPKWFCKIDEGSAGLLSVKWSPDACHILSISEFYLRISVWSLINKSVSYIKNPKAIESNALFSRDGQYLAVVERHDCKDFISIFTCSTWQVIKNFETDTKDLSGMLWSPDSTILCIWESILEYKVLLYSIDGRRLAVYSPYQWALGLKFVSWSSCGQFLALGSFDQKVRILNCSTWRSVAEHEHKTTITDSQITVCEEKEKPWANQQGAQFGSTKKIHYESVETRPVNISCVNPDLTKINPRIGVGFCSFSSCSRYLATINDNMPKALWIWSMTELKLSVLLIQKQAIKCFEWDPSETRLALCTGTNRVSIWTPELSSSVEIPNSMSFDVVKLSWSPTGSNIILFGRDQMCLACCKKNCLEENQT